MIQYKWPKVPPARFEPRSDVPDDLVVLSEVWDEQVYVTRRDQLEGLRVLDLGANIGAFTILAALCGARSVLAVEPNPENFTRLWDHCRLNRDAWEVVAMEIAVGAASGTATLDGAGGAAHISDGGGIEVEMVDIRHLIDTHGPFDLVKIDTEGGEWAVLRRLIDTSMSGVGAMIVEFHSPDIGPVPWPAEMHLSEFGWVLSRLARFGSLEVLGRPETGGMIRWQAYTPPER